MSAGQARVVCETLNLVAKWLIVLAAASQKVPRLDAVSKTLLLRGMLMLLKAEKIRRAAGPRPELR